MSEEIKLRAEVINFALKMEFALSCKDVIRGGNSWQDHVICEEIYEHILDRSHTLAQKITKANSVERNSDCWMETNEAWSDVAEQAVHLGNFAMMIADIAQPQDYRKKNPLQSLSEATKQLVKENERLRGEVFYEQKPPIKDDWLQRVYIGHGVKWTDKDALIHHKGAFYAIDGFRNTDYPEREGFPHICLYWRVEDGKRFARPIRDMVGKFELQPSEYSNEFIQHAALATTCPEGTYNPIPNTTEKE